MRTVEQTDRRDETTSRFWQFCECAYRLNGEKYKVLLMSNKQNIFTASLQFLGWSTKTDKCKLSSFKNVIFWSSYNLFRNKSLTSRHNQLPYISKHRAVSTALLRPHIERSTPYSTTHTALWTASCHFTLRLMNPAIKRNSVFIV